MIESEGQVTRSRRSLAIALTMSLLATACATPGVPIAAPDVRLDSVAIDKLGFYGQTFLLGFAVTNPNPFPLPVTRVRYEIRLDDRRFAGGETTGNFVIAANDADHFAIKVKMDLLRQESGFSMLLENGMSQTMRYELQGSLDIDIPGALQVPFTKSGDVRFGGR